ncbi:MAG: hypothetical protein HRU69_03735 [Flammeovirgaceae bacterium]|nr:MAG: hypothetical protein HRU69_03735 [Flammeovirgaceae bacterium]
MTDTPDHIRKKQKERWLSFSDAERFRLGFEMIDEVNEQIKSRIREQNPDFTDREVTAEFVRQLYKEELPAAYLAEVLTWIRAQSVSHT